ncbi:MAG: pantoate--beta-alanine ligase [Deltaproteobacteria bacterium]|nr:pantoate--beta-alanine ligase [Deltaproteobacteria bacterium]
MELLREPEQFRAACDRARAAGRRVGLVPTMGALHAGHLSLVAEARRRADFVAVTIFVNPTQFRPGEDFERYPRLLEADCAKCAQAGADVVFAPAREHMYPPGEETRVRPGATAEPLCGAHRPGHFEGVATIVTKLLVLAGPCVAVFGRKDYQQWRVIETLVRDLCLPAQVVGAPTVREPDGLALSSRNAYLSPAERGRALSIARGLSRAVRAFAAGERRAGTLRAMVQVQVAGAADRVDYVALGDPATLAPLPDAASVAGSALVAVAARFGTTRLIDNVVLGEDPAPIAWEGPDGDGG